MKVISHLFKIIFIFIPIQLFFIFFLGSCSSSIERNDKKPSSFLSFLDASIPGWFSPYKPEIIQGNFISKQMVERLKKGQTKEQVITILGTPLIVDSFNPEKWNYVFIIKKSEEVSENTSFFVEFQNNKLRVWGGESAENSTQYDKVLNN
ncbi:MAG: hypothetical protein CBD16_01780 [Betaproteobacteria bacterium TMED156]|nr:MAG: hypothetical protein CBD16_01780 [Betaproteobacteria bacterium TMED156]|tara:strand:- start:28 stop:477 length:450 start_codon:yes stop_codon:yes gene_type:complete